MSTKSRKAKHLSICTNPRDYDVETGSAGFESLRFVHSALPEIDAGTVDTRETFLDYPLSAPLLVSCMTGGSSEGFRANKNLALAAQNFGVPVGMGSIRVLFEHDDVFEHFHLKKLAPDVPVLANIGGAQIRDIKHDRISEMVLRLEADALVVHLNPGQELFQPDGDVNFKGIRDSIGRYVESSKTPVIVKETGFGISPALVKELFDLGVAYVDIAGSGGTNWIRVEGYRGDENSLDDAREFDSWGIPTAHLLAAIRKTHNHTYDGRIIASGGLRSGQDAAKSIALGSALAGMALPLIRSEVAGGVGAIIENLERTAATIRRTMVLTGSQNTRQFKHVPLWYDGAFESAVDSLVRASNRTAGV